MQLRPEKNVPSTAVHRFARVLCVCCFLCLSARVRAQEVQISFSEGGEFALSSGGERAVYEGGRLTEGGLSMRAEDILQTGAGGFVELRLEPGGVRIKIAENTSLIYSGSEPESGVMSFTLLYGRMRLSTAGSLPEEKGNVHIKAGQATAIFYEGDAGIDFIANAEESYIVHGEPVLRIYCFAGHSELVPLPAVTPGAAVSKLAVNEYESLSVEVQSPLSYMIHKPLDEGIIQYWNNHNFSGGMPLIASRAPAVAAAPPPIQNVPAATSPVDTPRIVERIQYVPADNSRNKKLLRVKNIFLITGLALAVGGAGIQSAAVFMPDHSGRLLANYGYIPLGLGIVLGGTALAINPQYQETNVTD